MLTFRNHSGVSARVARRVRPTKIHARCDWPPHGAGSTTRGRLRPGGPERASAAPSTRSVLVPLTASTRARNRPHKRRYAFGLGRVVWRGPSTVYPDSTNMLRNLAPMMWPWQALGNLWYRQTAVSHPIRGADAFRSTGPAPRARAPSRAIPAFTRRVGPGGSILRGLGAARAQRRHRRATGSRRRRS